MHTQDLGFGLEVLDVTIRIDKNKFKFKTWQSNTYSIKAVIYMFAGGYKCYQHRMA